MQKVLLLGDSIRMGYDEYVQMDFDKLFAKETNIIGI